MVYSIKIMRLGTIKEYLVDAVDVEYLSQWRWSWRCGYAARSRRSSDPVGNRWVHLHREVISRMGLSVPEGFCVDHINRDKTDNRRQNLRVVNRSDNGKNVSEDVKNVRRELVKRACRASSLLPRTIRQKESSKITAHSMNVRGFNVHRGQDNYQSALIVNLETGIFYDTLKEAAASVPMNWSTLRSMLAGYNPNTSKFFRVNERVKR